MKGGTWLERKVDQFVQIHKLADTLREVTERASRRGG